SPRLEESSTGRDKRYLFPDTSRCNKLVSRTSHVSPRREPAQKAASLHVSRQLMNHVIPSLAVLLNYGLHMFAAGTCKATASQLQLQQRLRTQTMHEACEERKLSDHSAQCGTAETVVIQWTI